MAKTLQFRRGTTSELTTQTGAVGELFVDTTKDTVVVMDGSTAGGFPLQRELVSGTTIKTVNGQSLLGGGNLTITGGSGSSFDQELNTTDDVLFNSALVGDVSIVGNEIAGVDSYGNSSALKVTSDLQVTGISTTTTQTPVTQDWGGGAYFQSARVEQSAQVEQSTLIINNVGDIYGNLLAPELNSMKVGDTVQIVQNFGFGSGIYTLTSVFSSNSGQFTASVSGSPANLYAMSGPSGTDYIRITKLNTATVSTETTPLSVTDSLVAVEGEFTVNGFLLNPNNIQGTLYSGSNIKTVNGQSLLGGGNLTITGGSGSSFDQELNTTDDVLFNSALVGDVSIVGNTILAVDSYGLSKDLIVDSKIITPALDVRVYTDTTENYQLNYDTGYGSYGYFDDYPWSRSLSFYNASGQNNAALNYLLTKQPGDVVNFSINTKKFGITTGYGVVDYITNYGYAVYVYFRSIVYIGGVNLEYNESGLNAGSKFIDQVIFESLPLSADATGVSIEGALTVNGLPVVGGSYDQDLNTTDDVVFNSALIGDVSIVGNTISAVDSYGLTGALVVDGELNVKFIEDVIITNSLVQGQDFNDIFTSYLFSGATTGDWYISSPLSSAFISKIQGFVGQTINVVVTLQGDTYSGVVQVNNVQDWGPGKQVNVTALSGSVLNLSTPNTSAYTSAATILFNSTEAVSVTPLSVTQSGVAITGDLILDDNIETPSNTNTVVKWAKITVGGQVYFTPLYI